MTIKINESSNNDNEMITLTLVTIATALGIIINIY